MGAGSGKTRRAKSSNATSDPSAPEKSSTVVDAKATETLTVDASKMISPETKERLEEELHRLETVERLAIAEEIKTARGHGDLSENAEYDEAKNAQGRLEDKILKLKEKLNESVVGESKDKAKDVVRYDSKVELFDVKKEQKLSYTLVSSLDQNISEGRLSAESPLATALQNKRAGDTVKVPLPNGKSRQIRIDKIL